MADRPILFSGPMIRALLEGRKSQTRRALRPCDTDCRWPMYPSYTNGVRDGASNNPHFDDLTEENGGQPLFLGNTPYCPGDRLWVRESIGRRTASFLGIEATNGVEEAFYFADDEPVLNEHEFNICPWWKRKQTLPGIHMPRGASRLTLTVTDVRVQRLQEISEEDAIAEGAIPLPPLMAEHASSTCSLEDWSHRNGYRDLWDSLNDKPDRPGCAWRDNPWIVAVSFTVERRNIDAGAA